MIAASNGWLPQVKDLLKFNAKIEVWNHHHLALTLAVEQGDYDIVNALLWAGADASSGLDQTLIARAEKQDDMAIVDLLDRSLAADNDGDDSDQIEIDEPESEKPN